MIAIAFVVFIIAVIAGLLSMTPMDGEQSPDERHATRLHRKD